MTETSRNVAWAATMQGHHGAGLRHAHSDEKIELGEISVLDRKAREEAEASLLANSATLSSGAGNRARDEEPDPFRTCFERDRDRILHSPAFRRLAGKTQVFVFPEDHQRTRLTHALEVAQVAVAVATSLRLNSTLAEAIALGHDCGHGAGGHASEEALSPFLPGGFDHATWGADVVLSQLNLCEETLDGVRNHSWSRPSPATPEGVVVSWADRIAYVCHDLEDAVETGIVTYDMVPGLVRERCGDTRSQQLRHFIAAMVTAAIESGRLGMTEPYAEALTELRAFNYENIYMRPASLLQGKMVIDVLKALVEYYADRPNHLPGDKWQQGEGIGANTDEALVAAVEYVAGMTDRFAFRQAVVNLGWDPTKLPSGVDVNR